MKCRDILKSHDYRITENSSYIELEKPSKHTVIIFKALPDSVNIRRTDLNGEWIKVDPEVIKALYLLCKELGWVK